MHISGIQANPSRHRGPREARGGEGEAAGGDSLRRFSALPARARVLGAPSSAILPPKASPIPRLTSTPFPHPGDAIPGRSSAGIPCAAVPAVRRAGTMRAGAKGRRILGAARLARVAGIAALGAGVGLLGLAGCGREAGTRPPGSPAPGKPRPNLLLVTIDTLRADHVGCYGYPRGITPVMDRLAARSTLFANVYAPLPLTGPNHTTILTGRPPWDTGVRYNGLALGRAETTLAEILAARGYETAAFVSAWPLHHTVSGLDQGFDLYDDQFHGVERLAPATTHAAMRWIRREHHAPFLAWVHYFDPHAPYAPPEPFRSRWILEGPEPRRQVSLYDGEIAFADAALGVLLRGLARQGLDATTAVVVTSDHGESLLEHDDPFDHGDLLFEEHIRVPLLVRPPGGVAPRRVAQPLLSTDILAMMLETLGLPVPEGVPRGPLPGTGGGGARARFHAFFESNQCDTEAQAKTHCWPPGNAGKLHALLDGPWKLIRHPKSGGIDWMLFNLASDPRETQNLWSTGGERAEAMRAELERWRQSLPPAPDRPDVDRESLRKLRELGYL